MKVTSFETVEHRRPHAHTSLMPYLYRLGPAGVHKTYVTVAGTGEHWFMTTLLNHKAPNTGAGAAHREAGARGITESLCRTGAGVSSGCDGGPPA